MLRYGGPTFQTAASTMFGVSALISRRTIRPSNIDDPHWHEWLTKDPSPRVLLDTSDEHLESLISVIEPLEDAWTHLRQCVSQERLESNDSVASIINLEAAARVFSYYIANHSPPYRKTSLVEEIMRFYDRLRDHCSDAKQPEAQPLLIDETYSALQAKEGELLGEIAPLDSFYELGDELERRIGLGWSNREDNAAVLRHDVEDAIKQDVGKLEGKQDDTRPMDKQGLVDAFFGSARGQSVRTKSPASEKFLVEVVQRCG